MVRVYLGGMGGLGRLGGMGGLGRLRRLRGMRRLRRLREMRRLGVAIFSKKVFKFLAIEKKILTCDHNI